MTRRRVTLWTGEALAESLHLAFLVGLYDAGNDNGRPAFDDDHDADANGHRRADRSLKT